MLAIACIEPRLRERSDGRPFGVWSKVFWNDKLITIHYLFVIVVAIDSGQASKCYVIAICRVLVGVLER